MIWSRGALSPEVRSLLERERVVAVLPAAARARAIARARAALVAGVATRLIPSPASSTASWAAAVAGLACLGTVAATAAAYQFGVRARPTVPVTASPPAAPEASRPRVLDRPVIDLPLAESTRFPGRSPTSGGRAAQDELRLLEQARAAVSREDFVAAKQLLDEDGRRFKVGRLAEEREALRVRALLGLGRRNEARRAARDFEARFPRSPLLSTISQMPDSVP